MLIDARDGITSRGFKPTTASGALAYVIDPMQVGDRVQITDLINKDGAKVGVFKVQAMIPAVRDSSKKYSTRISEGILTVERIA